MNLKTLRNRPASQTFFSSLSGLLVPVLAAALVTACVTVNVNFPESTVQKATDDYVKELYRAKERSHSNTSSEVPGAKKPPAPKPQSGPGAAEGDPGKPAMGEPQSWLDLVLPSAYAVEADLNFRVDTPKATKIREKLAASVGEVIAQKKAGNLGESNDGHLVVKATKPLLVKKLEGLVKDENSERESLYEEVQSANKIAKSRLADIKKSFARSFQSESPSGTWIQDAGGAWSQK